MKKCSRCAKKIKAPKRICAKCQRDRSRDAYLRRKYGITLKQYDAIKVAQGGVCYLCRRANGRTRNLAVDHNHKTGEVRGLLCSPCNKGVVGHLRDEPEAGLRLHRYLTDPPARSVLRGITVTYTDGS